MSPARTTLGRVVGVAGIVLSLTWYLAWQIAHRGSFGYARAIYAFDDADEWRYTACSRLVEHGYTLFSQVFSAQPPLLFLSLAGSMRIFGDSISGARWVEVSFGLLGLVATTGIAWLLAGPVAGGVTAAILSVSPAFLVYSRAIEAEGPMMALVALSLLLALAYRRTGWPLLPIVAGLVLGAAVLTKLFAIEAILPGLWVVLGRRDERRRFLAPLSFVAGALLPVAVEMAVVSPREQWSQVVSLHNQASHIKLPGALSTLEVLKQFASLDLGIALLAAAGLVVLGLLSDWDDLIFLLLWVPGSVLMLTLFHPLFPHHPVILLPGLAVASGAAVTVWVEQLRSHRWLAALPLTTVVFAYLALLPRLAHDDRHALVAGAPLGSLHLAAFVTRHTSQHDFIVVDDLAVADLAHRLVPPGLCDPSNVRLRTGYLPARESIAQTTRYRARLVLPSSGLYLQVPGYLEWVRRHYRPVAAPDGHEAFFRK